MHVAAIATARTSTISHLRIASIHLLVSCKHNIDEKPKLEKLREKKLPVRKEMGSRTV